jgi:hypothetical protein
LYTSSQDHITRWSLTDATHELLPYQAQRVQSFGERDVLLTASHDRMVLSLIEEGTASILTYLPLGTYEFVQGPAGFLSLYETTRHRLILLDPGNREQPIMLNEEAILWSWNRAGDQLLTTSGYDLRRYLRFENRSETLTRLSTPIDSLTWYPLGVTALYQSDGDTVAVRLNDPAGPTDVTLAQDMPGAMWLSQEGTELFVFHKTDGVDTLYRRALQQ